MLMMMMAKTPLRLSTSSAGYIFWVLAITVFDHFVAQSKGSQQFFSPEVCCGDVPLKMDDHSQCCGNSSYSSAESMCCWDLRRGHYVLSLPTSVSPASNSVVLKRRNSLATQLGLGQNLDEQPLHNQHRPVDTARFLTCCQDKLYDFRFYTCCDGVVRKQSLNGNTGCCGRNVYDPYSQLCCQGRILPKATFSSYCCGDKSYDNTKEVCCSEIVFPGAKPTSASASAASTSSPNSLSCCGNGTFDVDKELCCSGRRLEKRKPSSYCCGADQFDWDTEVCCNGFVHTKRAETDLCCARQIYDSSTHICCTDTIIPRKMSSSTSTQGGSTHRLIRLSRRRFDILTSSDDESELCCGNNATYNFDTEICCDGRVFQRDDPSPTGDDPSSSSSVPSALKCCGKQLYSDDREICCQGQVLPKATRAEDCCGPRVFNVQNQVCCQGVIHDLLESDSLLYCCGNSTFHPLKQTCCNGKKSAKAAVLSNEA